MEKILTISIAAYNIENYIDKLMESLIDSERMDEIEILVVDDGSKDKTNEIACKYSKKYPETVRVITKENGGHGSTINTGIKNASGKYFKAIDGDDWVESESLKQIIPLLYELDDEMVICDYNKCFSDGRVVVEKFDNIESMKSYSFDDLTKKVKWMCYHTIIYKTSILKDNNIRLDEKCFYVDSEYDLFPIPFVNSVFYFGKSLYCYRLGDTEQSVSPESRMKNIKNGYTVAKRLVQMCKTQIEGLPESKSNYILYGAADQCIWHIKSLLIFPVSLRKMKEIKKFDKAIKNNDLRVYKMMEKQGKESRVINMFRKTFYLTYYPLAIYKKIKK